MKNLKLFSEMIDPDAQQTNKLKTRRGNMRSSGADNPSNPASSGMQADRIMSCSFMRKLFPMLSLLVVPVLIHTGFTFAYAEDTKTPTVVVSPSPAVPAKDQAQIPQQSQEQSVSDNYKYYPLGKPDPFHPFVQVEIEAKKKEAKKISPYPLEREEIEKYILTGIVGDELRRLAIVEIMEEGSLKYYPLLKGTHIGVNNGKVIEIMKDRVIIEEIDKKKTKRIILKLHKNNEVNP